MADLDIALEVAKGTATTAAAFVTALFLIPSKYTSIKHTRFSLSTKKRKKLDALLESGRWENAPAAELELAFADAFGFALDGRIIRHIFRRRNVISHIRNVKMCQLMVQLPEDGQRLEASRDRRCSFRRSAVRAFLAGLVPVAILLFTVPLLPAAVPKIFIAWAFGFIIVWSPYCLWVSAKFEAAHDVTTASTKNYPEDKDAVVLEGSEIRS